jgi:hypothetical protein
MAEPRREVIPPGEAMSSDAAPAPARASGRFRSRGELGLFAGAGAALLASCVLSPGQADAGPVVCLFRLATGLPCPACGLTRSFVALGNGDLRAALRHHAFGPIVYAIFAAFVALKLAELARGRLLLGRGALARLAIAGGVLAAIWLPWSVWRMIA